MNNFHQDTFYFNLLKTKNIDNNTIDILNNTVWYKKKIVLTFKMYEVNFTIYSDKIYIKPILDYNTQQFKNIFHFNFLNWFRTDKIVEIVEYN